VSVAQSATTSASMLARATPAHKMGTANAYHALTFGWLVGEVIRCPRECIDGGDVTPHGSGHERGCDREVFVMASRVAETLAVGLVNMHGDGLPLRLSHARAVVDCPRHHKEEVGQTVQIDNQQHVHRACAKSDDASLCPPADCPGQMEP